MSQTKQTFSESGTFLINTGGQGVGPDGLALLFTETGTQSMVLKVNTAPPGSTPSYTNIPYLNGSLALQSAGTAITASGLAYVSAEYAALDLYGTLTATSGSLVVQVGPANLGNPEGAIPAADVTPGTFGANSGATGAYTVPNGLIVAAGGSTTTGAAAFNDAVTFGASGVGAAKSLTTITKAVTAIPNNTATTILTLTVPNAAHSGSVLVRATSSLGAGGAIGANEATATNCYIVSYTRTAGVNATAAISSAFGAAATAVAGAATVTGAVTVAAVSGAVGAVNTFPIQVTVVRSGGSSTNHTCVVEASILNANGSGATLA